MGQRTPRTEEPRNLVKKRRVNTVWCFDKNFLPFIINDTWTDAADVLISDSFYWFDSRHTRVKSNIVE